MTTQPAYFTTNQLSSIQHGNQGSRFVHNCRIKLVSFSTFLHWMKTYFWFHLTPAHFYVFYLLQLRNYFVFYGEYNANNWDELFGQMKITSRNNKEWLPLAANKDTISYYTRIMLIYDTVYWTCYSCSTLNIYPLYLNMSPIILFLFTAVMWKHNQNYWKRNHATCDNLLWESSHLVAVI